MTSNDQASSSPAAARYPSMTGEDGAGLARYGVVGDPIAHSKSPMIHRAFAQATGQMLSYDKFHVVAEDFTRFVCDFFDNGGSGLNVTVPHKLAAAALAEELTPRAQRAGAVNTLLRGPQGRLLGDNTDGAGLLADLKRLGAPVTDARIVIIGAGGAVRGILGPLLTEKPAEVWIANRNATRAAELIKEFALENQQTVLRSSDLLRLQEAGATDLLLQATPLGLHGELPDLAESLIGPKTFAYDLGYTEGRTLFEIWALSKGAKQVASGIGMLIEQAAEAFMVWRGVRPDTRALHATYGPSPPVVSNKP